MNSSRYDINENYNENICYDISLKLFIDAMMADTEAELISLIDGNSNIDFDRNCMCGNFKSNDKENKSQHIEKYFDFSCNSCRMLSSFINIKEDFTKKKFLYPSEGEYSSIVSVREIKKPKIYFNMENKSSIRYFINKITNNSGDKKNQEITKSITNYNCDEFLSRHINNMYINYIQSSVGINFIPKLFKSFLCGKNGYQMEEESNSGDLLKYSEDEHFFTEKNIISILFQTLIFFHFFSHKNIFIDYPSVVSLSIKKRKQFTYNSYMGIKIKSDISLKLNKKSNVFVDFDSFRVYNDKNIHLIKSHDNIMGGGKLKKREFIIPYLDDNDKKNWEILSLLSKKGNVYESSSICVYFLFLSLFGGIKSIRDHLNQEGKIKSIWKIMWNDSESVLNEMIENETEIFHRPEKICRFIEDKKLKTNICSLILKGWNNL